MLRMFIWLASATQLAIGVPLVVAEGAGSGGTGAAHALSAQPRHALVQLASFPGRNRGRDVLSPQPYYRETPRATLASARSGQASSEPDESMFTGDVWLPGTVAIPDACSQYGAAIVVEDPSGILPDLSATNDEQTDGAALTKSETDLSQSLATGDVSGLCLQSAGSRFLPADEATQLRYGDQIPLENRARQVVRLGVGKNVMRVKVRF